MSEQKTITPKPQYASDAVHLLRTTQQMQYVLSQMADQKANMLLAASFVIFSVTLSQVHNMARPIPLLVLGAAAFASAVLAILAVMPSFKVPPRPEGPANILFFGSFTQVPEDEFIERILDVSKDQRSIYEAWAHDIYQNGRVLAAKKYRFLSHAYRILLAGLVASFVAFVAPYLLGALGL